MKNYLCALLLAGAGASVCLPQAMAQEAPKSAKKSAGKPAAKKAHAKSASKKHAAPQAATDEDDIEPDVTASTTVDYDCELGRKLTIYENQADSQHVALRWNKRLHRLTRVSTTTGAGRFENRKYGLVWIGIPAKGILLDSKKGQQLANECKNAEQARPKQPQQAAEQAPTSAEESTNLASQ